jgi:hypothetical protein
LRFSSSLFQLLAIILPCSPDQKNQPADNLSVVPSELSGQASDGAVLATGLQPQDTESLGNDHALLGVVGRGDSLEDLQAVHGGLTTSGLVGDHTADSLVEDAGRRTEVERSVGLVETGRLVEVGVVLHCT